MYTEFAKKKVFEQLTLKLSLSRKQNHIREIFIGSGGSLMVCSPPMKLVSRLVSKLGSFVLIHVYHVTFMCLSSPNSQFMSLETSCKHLQHC